MNRISRNIIIVTSVVILFLASILQPYFVLITHFGPSSSCINCTIIEDTFYISLIKLFIPLCFIYLILRLMRLKNWISCLILTTYYALTSFIVLTIPLFDDRIAAWSTFTKEEIWKEGFILAFPSLLIVSILLFTIMLKLNKLLPTLDKNHSTETF